MHGCKLVDNTIPNILSFPIDSKFSVFHTRKQNSKIEAGRNVCLWSAGLVFFRLVLSGFFPRATFLHFYIFKLFCPSRILTALESKIDVGKRVEKKPKPNHNKKDQKPSHPTKKPQKTRQNTNPKQPTKNPREAYLNKI